MQGMIRKQSGSTEETKLSYIMAKPANMQGMSTDAPDRGRNPDNEADDRRNGPTSAPSRPAEEERETLLQAELQGIQNINHVIEGVVDSLERAKQNMEVRIGRADGRLHI